MEAELERLGMTEVEQPEAPALSMSSRQKVTSVSWNVFAFAGQCEEVETACPTTESPVVSATEAWKSIQIKFVHWHAITIVFWISPHSVYGWFLGEVASEVSQEPAHGERPTISPGSETDGANGLTEPVTLDGYTDMGDDDAWLISLTNRTYNPLTCIRDNWGLCQQFKPKQKGFRGITTNLQQIMKYVEGTVDQFFGPQLAPNGPHGTL